MGFRANRFEAGKVGNGISQGLLAVSKIAKSVIAVVAEESANFFRVVAMVNDQLVLHNDSVLLGESIAYSASPVLAGQHSVVVKKSESVVHPEIHGALIERLVIPKFLKLNDLWIRGERIARATWNSGIASACRRMGMKAAKCVRNSASGAWVGLPSVISLSAMSHGEHASVSLLALPVGQNNDRTWLAGVADSALHGDIPVEIIPRFYELASGAYVLVAGDNRDAGAENAPVALKCLGWHRSSAVVAGNLASHSESALGILVSKIKRLTAAVFVQDQAEASLSRRSLIVRSNRTWTSRVSRGCFWFSMYHKYTRSDYREQLGGRKITGKLAMSFA